MRSSTCSPEEKEGWITKAIDRPFHIEHALVLPQLFSGETDFRPREATVIKEKNTRDEIILVGVGGEGKRNYAEQLWKYYCE